MISICLAGMPATQDEVRELIRAYGELGEEGLWANIEYFLKRVIPVAEECDVVMALHPDDPPYPIFGFAEGDYM